LKFLVKKMLKNKLNNRNIIYDIKYLIHSIVFI